jgi:hypothetical protein
MNDAAMNTQPLTAAERTRPMPVGKPSKLNMGLRLARRVGAKMDATWTWDDARDHLDQATGAELDAWSLDKITDEAIKTRDKTVSS